MRLLVLGATGRVGSAAVTAAKAAGHATIAFVRDPARLKAPADSIAVGDLAKPETVAAALAIGIDAVLNAVGADPLKPSTVVTDAARVIVSEMSRHGPRRYVAITGTAQMPKTWLGALSIAILRRTQVGHAVRDHQGAFDIVTASDLEWTLAACPWIKDGPATGAWREHATFPGGMKAIAPADVAAFLVHAVASPGYARRIVGLW